MPEAELLRSIVVFVWMRTCTCFALSIGMRLCIPLLKAGLTIPLSIHRWKNEVHVRLFAFLDLGRSSLAQLLGFAVGRHCEDVLVGFNMHTCLTRCKQKARLIELIVMFAFIFRFESNRLSIGI